MKKLAIISSFVLVLSVLSINAVAATGVLPPLDKVSFQLSAEQWAVSTTAKVVVNIDATLNEAQLGTIHNQIMNNLQKITGNVDWHITEFSRSKNQSGLEQLYAQAEARIPENGLTDLRKKIHNYNRHQKKSKISAVFAGFSRRSIKKRQRVVAFFWHSRGK